MACWLPENVELNSRIIIPTPTCVITRSKVALALLCLMETSQSCGSWYKRRSQFP